MAVAIGSYFGQDVQVVVDRLLGEQMSDGDWNCEAENGSMRGSFHTTIDVLEGLLEHERATGGSPEVTSARRRGEEYLLERRMLRRLSTAEVIDPAWTRFSFPTRYFYDALRGLDYLRSAGVVPDERVAEAIELVKSRRADDGRWPLEHASRPEGAPLVRVGASVIRVASVAVDQWLPPLRDRQHRCLDRTRPAQPAQQRGRCRSPRRYPGGLRRGVPAPAVP